MQTIKPLSANHGATMGEHGLDGGEICKRLGGRQGRGWRTEVCNRWGRITYRVPPHWASTGFAPQWTSMGWEGGGAEFANDWAAGRGVGGRAKFANDWSHNILHVSTMDEYGGGPDFAND